MIKIGINGLVGLEEWFLNLDTVNLLKLLVSDLYDIDYLAYLLKYDSTHSRIKSEIKIDGNYLIVDENKIKVTSNRDQPNKLDFV